MAPTFLTLYNSIIYLPTTAYYVIPTIQLWYPSYKAIKTFFLYFSTQFQEKYEGNLIVAQARSLPYFPHFIKVSTAENENL